jgi:hypothetical protein
MSTWQAFAAVLLILTSTRAMAAMPEDVSKAPWFTHCRKLSADRAANYSDVVRHSVVYAWKTDLGYRWDWENGVRASASEHYCVRLALYGKRDHFIENVTFLCSVTDRDKPTQVWTFGNVEVAESLCPMDMDDRARIDTRGQKP